MDVGLVSEYYLTYNDAKFLREGTVDGTPCGVFDFTFKNHDAGDHSHQVIFIDPKTKVVRRREAYSLEGKLQAVYLFNEPKEIKPGIWFPSTIEATNADRKLAGVTAYHDIKVNIGIPDSTFKL
jgi:outer membrane lipoprotein-sorting protein